MKRAQHSHDRPPGGQPRLPDFIGIGAQKAGTTWTHEQLRQHPQLCLAQTKELNFFYGDADREWYTAQWQHATPQQICGEISPNYFAQQGVAEAMHALVPAAKLFCILRNPVDRAYSQWKMARALGNIPRSIPFIEAFRGNRRWMAEQGDYPELLGRFFRYYPPQQLEILFFDDLVDQPRQFLWRLFRYLGVDPDFITTGSEKAVWRASDDRPLPEHEAAELRSYYRASIGRLETLTGRDLQHWLAPESG